MSSKALLGPFVALSMHVPFAATPIVKKEFFALVSVRTAPLRYRALKRLAIVDLADGCRGSELVLKRNVNNDVVEPLEINPVGAGNACIAAAS